MELGLRLGADVPVFLFGRNALGEGVGERLTGARFGARLVPRSDASSLGFHERNLLRCRVDTGYETAQNIALFVGAGPQ